MPSMLIYKHKVYQPKFFIWVVLVLEYKCKKAKLQAGIKPTALCSAIDKENSIEFPLDSATLYIQLLLWLCTLPPTVLMPVSWLLCHMLWPWLVTIYVTWPWPFCDFSHTFVTLWLSRDISHTPPKRKEKKKKRNINIDLAVLPSHDNKFTTFLS